MADETDTPSSMVARLAVTESSEVPSEMEINSESKISKSDDSEKEGETLTEGEEMQLQTVGATHVFDDISEDYEDEDDTNLVVLDPNHVRIESV